MSHNRTFKYDYSKGKANEKIVLTTINKYFNDNAKGMGQYSKFDFQGKNIYELKSRNITHDHMKTTIFPVDKLLLPSSLKYEKFILLFKFLDGLYYIEYDKKLFSKFGIADYKRKDREDKADVKKPYYFIPVELLTKIKLDDDEDTETESDLIVSFD